MSELFLEVQQKRYKWLVPSSELKVHELKDQIGERCKGDVLLHPFHKKLRFLCSGQHLVDDDHVPMAPSVLQVLGPGSVVQMFGLFCDRDGKPLPPAPKPAPRPAPTRAPASGYAQEMPMLTNWSQSYQSSQEEDDLSLARALKASKEAFQADEEAQLRWALEESALLAEQEERQREEAARLAAQEEEIQKFYMDAADAQNKKSKGSSSSSTTARAEAALQELESEEEAMAWDSASDKEDSDDEGPPPLELLPDSEE